MEEVASSLGTYVLLSGLHNSSTYIYTYSDVGPAISTPWWPERDVPCSPKIATHEPQRAGLIFNMSSREGCGGLVLSSLNLYIDTYCSYLLATTLVDMLTLRVLLLKIFPLICL